MSDRNPIANAFVAVALMAGSLLFLWSIRAAETVPVEYRSASPGFGWAWDFDYAAGMTEAGRFGEAPQPWAAVAAGDRLLLPVDQPLRTRGLKMTYRGMPAAGRFRVDISIASLDPDVAYPREFSVAEARRGLRVSDQRFVLETITPNYLRLRATGGRTGGNNLTPHQGPS